MCRLTSKDLSFLAGSRCCPNRPWRNDPQLSPTNSIENSYKPGITLSSALGGESRSSTTWSSHTNRFRGTLWFRPGSIDSTRWKDTGFGICSSSSIWYRVWSGAIKWSPRSDRQVLDGSKVVITRISRLGSCTRLALRSTSYVSIIMSCSLITVFCFSRYSAALCSVSGNSMPKTFCQSWWHFLNFSSVSACMSASYVLDTTVSCLT